MMRIITGRARGVKLETLPGEATRPTSERVKGAIFSSLQFELEGRRVLDLFAGSGQMGLEALSRGAVSCTFADASPEAMAVVKENAKRTGFFDACRYLISDYRNVIRKAAGRDEYDLIFIDPPYA
ncbi:MAG: RsmD family RNA methyltransferase, partial [Clostridia bacterium]|nr:RsmD family RNA methyltransferase [Clostridia bacterium]